MSSLYNVFSVEIIECVDLRQYPVLNDFKMGNLIHEHILTFTPLLFIFPRTYKLSCVQHHGQQC